MAAVFETDGIFSQNNELRMRSDLLLACMHVRLHAHCKHWAGGGGRGGAVQRRQRRIVLLNDAVLWCVISADIVPYPYAPYASNKGFLCC